MSASLIYFAVGAIAAIRGGRQAGCVGMLMLLTAWPLFLLAGLSYHGLSVIGLIIWRSRHCPVCHRAWHNCPNRR